MNVNDMEVVRGLLIQNGYIETKEEAEADAILLMTCSIRDGAEEKIWKRLKHLKRNQRRPRTVAVLGKYMCILKVFYCDGMVWVDRPN